MTRPPTPTNPRTSIRAAITQTGRPVRPCTPKRFAPRLLGDQPAQHGSKGICASLVALRAKTSWLVAAHGHRAVHWTGLKTRTCLRCEATGAADRPPNPSRWRPHPDPELESVRPSMRARPEATRPVTDAPPGIAPTTIGKQEAEQSAAEESLGLATADPRRATASFRLFARLHFGLVDVLRRVAAKLSRAGPRPLGKR